MFWPVIMLFSVFWLREWLPFSTVQAWAAPACFVFVVGLLGGSVRRRQAAS